MKVLFEKQGIQLVEYTWPEVKSKVKAANQELFEAIESVNPKSHETFVKINYPFGATIADEGYFCLPNRNGTLVPAQASDIDPEIKRLFDYSHIPLGFLLNKGSEVFAKLEDHIVTLRILQPGTLFAVFEIMDILSGISTRPVWCVAAGARSTFMLPKITDNMGHKRLKKKHPNIPAVPPSTFEAHEQVFKAISAHPSHAKKWSCDVLYFTRAWFDHPKATERFSKLYNYFFRLGHIQSTYAINEHAAHLMWQRFAVLLGKRNLKPRPYLADTLQRLLNIIMGTLPGFAVADQSEDLAPTKIIQEEYINVYGLKKYLPTILCPAQFLEPKKPNLIYYSLSCPTLYEGAPSHKNPIPIIDDLRSIKLMLDTLLTAVHKKTFSLPDVCSSLNHVHFDYFHTGQDIYNEIKNVKEMLEADPQFLSDKKLYKGREVCSTSPFLNGVIRISINQTG